MLQEKENLEHSCYKTIDFVSFPSDKGSLGVVNDHSLLELIDFIHLPMLIVFLMILFIV